MKQYLYFESQEGGMDMFSFSDASNLIRLVGWKQPLCKNEDDKLCLWLETAEIGDYFVHRLGYVIRIKDII